MPFGMYGYPQVVVFNGKAYIGGGAASTNRERQTVIVYMIVKRTPMTHYLHIHANICP